jgi:hypothetical protein
MQVMMMMNEKGVGGCEGEVKERKKERERENIETDREREVGEAAVEA